MVAMACVSSASDAGGLKRRPSLGRQITKMAAPRTTVWKLDPHSRAKHAILRRYLEAWTPILTRGGFPKIAYVDGFAGPGRYEGGEDGSPIIALKSVLAHRHRIQGQVLFLFVEERPDRADELNRLIDALSPPPNFLIMVQGGRRFEQAFAEFRQLHAGWRGNLPPTFAFIDPFGWTGAPFTVVKEILSHPSCETLVTFMYEEINRFIGHPDQGANFDSFFGAGSWRHCEGCGTPAARNRFLHDLYLEQLRNAAGVRHVRSFQMRNASGLTDYYLFYATNALAGLKKMKEAMWSVDRSGEFTFSDATNLNQMVLFGAEPQYDDLRRQILARFAGRLVTVGEIEEFVLTETAFRETHYRRQILKPLELAEPPAITVLNPPPGRRRGTFASLDMRVSFT
jgi:three-Cys-motif partner protein